MVIMMPIHVDNDDDDDNNDSYASSFSDED